MKAAIFLLGVFALFMVAEAADSACDASLTSDVGYTDDEISNMLFCFGNGKEFNGKKTCQIGCRLACQQPGCSGFKECTQIPNERLHKYKCHCNSS